MVVAEPKYSFRYSFYSQKPLVLGFMANNHYQISSSIERCTLAIEATFLDGILAL